MRQMSVSHVDGKGSENSHEARPQGDGYGEPQGRRDEELCLHEVQFGDKSQKDYAETH